MAILWIAKLRHPKVSYPSPDVSFFFDRPFDKRTNYRRRYLKTRYQICNKHSALSMCHLGVNKFPIDWKGWNCQFHEVSTHNAQWAQYFKNCQKLTKSARAITKTKIGTGSFLVFSEWNIKIDLECWCHCDCKTIKTTCRLNMLV